MKRTTYITGLSTLFMLAAAQPAAAHTLTGALGGLHNGLAHPFLGIDHMLAMLAVGLWAAQLGGSALWKVPLAFVGTMLIGAWLGLGGDIHSVRRNCGRGLGAGAGSGNQSAMAAGATACGPLVGVFALFHGFAHGSELPLAAAPLGYFAGFAVATATLHGLGAAAGCLLSAHAQNRLVRAGGAGLAGAGLLLLLIGLSALERDPDTQMQERIDRLVARFTLIGEQRMRDLPVYNPALGVEAVGFQPVETGCIGVLITPWFMNLMLLPELPQHAIAANAQRVNRELGSGTHDFMVGEDEELGRYAFISLASPMFAFADQAAARQAARAGIDRLVNANQATPGANTEHTVHFRPSAKPDMARRAFLQGRRPGSRLTPG